MKMRNIKRNQKGIVSLVVTMIVVVIIGIIVIAFSNFTRREEEQVFERQLSSEAFYAAESGINDAREVLRNTPPGTGFLVNEKTECESPEFDEQLQGDNVKYSCLLIDPHPSSLEYGHVGKGESLIFPVQDKDNQAIGRMDIHWHDTQISTAEFSGCNTSSTDLPESWPSVNNCAAPMLRVELVPVTGSFSRSSLENNAKVVFVKPRNGGGGSWNYNSATSGEITFGGCTEGSLSFARPKHCRFKLAGLGQRRYYIRITSLYANSTLTICSTNCNSRNKELAGAQALVDSTGRAAGILRRVQVRVGISGFEGPYPSFGIESAEDLCKQYAILPSPTLTQVADNAGCSLP